MKKFKFQLDTVMKVYKLHQDHAQAALQEKVAADTLANQKLQECQEELQKSSASADSKHSQVSSVAELLQHRLFLDRLKTAVDGHKQICMQTKQDVDVARDALVEANRRTKTIENLKEKQYRQYCLDALREEQSFMDEMALRKKHQA